MNLALILLAVITGTGALLYLHHRLTAPGPDSDTGKTAAESEPPQEECCGMHITCEKDSLLAAVSQKIEYYDDEELDRFAGRGADAYTPDESDEFRDVMLTMRPDEIAGWARSLQLRDITLPQDVRDELILIVSEERARRAKSPADA